MALQVPLSAYSLVLLLNAFRSTDTSGLRLSIKLARLSLCGPLGLTCDNLFDSLQVLVSKLLLHSAKCHSGQVAWAVTYVTMVL